MYERLVFFPIGLIVAFIGVHFHLMYISTGILIGMAILVFDAIRGREGIFRLDVGCVFLAIGVAFLLAAKFVCDEYGLTFDELDHARAFSKYARNLPGLGVAFITMGLGGIVKSLFDRS